MYVYHILENTILKLNLKFELEIGKLEKVDIWGEN
jgi:hypothetical protein